MEVPLSITTSPNGPYDDGLGPDGYLSYRYRGTDPNHRDNRGLAFAMREALPLVYFFGLAPGRYLALWPALIVQKDDATLTFSVALDDVAHAGLPQGMAASEAGDIRRQYVTTLARRRVHQQAFRERVLRAYRGQCALCHLKHTELLEAAHIVSDSEEGEPVVSNGLALCRLHHGAFDRFFLGVRPDYVIEVRPDVLHEEDGPTLKHAIQGMHGRRIMLPRRRADRPEKELLEVRYGRFLERARAG
jgi:putative restriction endonuclease